jgi:long-chain acyl-CoA synthetase
MVTRMPLVNDIIRSLESWGPNPVMIQRSPQGMETVVDSGMFLARIETYVSSLSEAGIRDGMLVPLFVDNSWEFPTLFFALNRLGAVPVMVKNAFRRMEIEAIFNGCRPDALICDPEIREYIGTLADGIPILEKCEGRLRPVSGKIRPRPASAPIPASGTVSVNYTYRGIGRPLGSMVGEKGYIDAADRYQRYVQFTPGDTALALLPMNHIFTLISSIMLPLMNSLTTYILQSMNPKAILDVLQNRNIHCLSSIPEILVMLARVKRDENITDSLKVLVSGGSTLSEDHHNLISDKFGVEVLNGYGLTEIAPVTANLRNGSKIGTLGEFCTGLPGRLAENADSQSGEIQVKANDTFFGYLNEPDLSAEVMDGEWFRTGDLARVSNGYVYFLGETKRTRKVNGQLVDLTEVEQALLNTGLVDQAVVDGQTNHVHAEISPVQGAEAEDRLFQRKLRSAMSELIAAYKIPRIFKKAGGIDEP